MIKKVLDVWGDFLKSPDSASVLGTDKEGWFGETGTESLLHVANLGQTTYSFDELFHCDPKAKNHGYKSWDDFVRLRYEIQTISANVAFISSPAKSRMWHVVSHLPMTTTLLSMHANRRHTRSHTMFTVVTSFG